MACRLLLISRCHSIKPESDSAILQEDYPRLHVRVSSDMTVFRPVRDQKLIGEVNQISCDHIGMLVHGRCLCPSPSDSGSDWILLSVSLMN